MTAQAKGWILLFAHLLLVGSIAGKYAWERHTCPRVWTRATQYDPEQPLRGRYLALTLHADVCALAGGVAKDDTPFDDLPAETKENLKKREPPSHEWTVHTAAKDGKLVGVEEKNSTPDTQTLTQPPFLPCGYASLSEPVEFFIAEHAKTPFPLSKGEELWAEVTVPPSGPPRPIHLAISDGRNFRVLDLR